jgi:serine/threonine protein kinase
VGDKLRVVVDFDTKHDDELVDAIAEEFAQRLRAGENPGIEEYAALHPSSAAMIRMVLESVAYLERAKSKPVLVAAQPTDAGQFSQRLATQPPDASVIGEYRLIRELGRGGMGVVYEAEHEELGRRVAIKILPSHLVANDSLRARFRREAQAAARLHHTNIVPVFAIGVTSTPCYFVMQLIHGQSLDTVLQAVFCAQGQQAQPQVAATLVDTDTPWNGTAAWARNGATALARLQPHDYCQAIARIGMQVADALEHAHQRGVLHRDIKPGNLLLDEHGDVWVTDFGVAKLTEQSDLTRPGGMVGTLHYMPPERFSGDSDARGDVYSLGLTLYELLALRPAFPDTTPQQLMTLVRSGPQLQIRKHNPNVPADLETIIGKAAALEPSQRYTSAGALADDLRRFLEGRPILARRTGIVERGWRWTRRNPLLASAWGGLAASVFCGLFILVVAWSRTSAANAEVARTNARLEQSLQAETQLREQSARSAELALDALNRTFTRFAPTRHQVSAPREFPVEPSETTVPPEAVALLEELLQTYEAIARNGEAFTVLQPQVAEARHRRGDILQRLGRYPEAEQAYRSARDLYHKLPESTVLEASVEIELGRVYRAWHQHNDAQSAFTRAMFAVEMDPRPEARYELALALVEQAGRDLFTRDPSEGRFSTASGVQQATQILQQLVQDYPAEPEYRHLLARCWSGQSQGTALLRELVADYPTVPDYEMDLCESLDQLARYRSPWGEELLLEAIGRSSELRRIYPNIPEYAAAHARYLDHLSRFLMDSGDYSTATQFLRRAIAIQARLVHDTPKVTAYALWLALMQRSLGEALAGMGELAEARPLLEDATTRAVALYRNDARLVGLKPFLALAHRDLLRILVQLGEVEEAEMVRQQMTSWNVP